MIVAIKSPRVFFRTDASISIGTGHVIRCLTLAEALRKKGAECHFICRKLQGNINELIQSRGFTLHILPASNEKNNEIKKRAQENSCKLDNLLLDSFDDATKTKTVIGTKFVDWIIVDHYELDARWERIIKPLCKNLMVIDDLANRSHFCDVILDQNYESSERYKNFIHSSCLQILGPRYALIRPEYAKFRSLKKFKLKRVSKIFIYFGGSDQFNLTSTALKALTVPSLKNLWVDIVVGKNYTDSTFLNQIAKKRGRVNIHVPRTHLADLMSSADIAIGAGGVTNWERICLGLPGLVITIAENQIPITEILNQKGIIRYLGRAEEVTEKIIEEALISEINSRCDLKRVAPGMTLCDGQGTSRVVKIIYDRM